MQQAIDILRERIEGIERTNIILGGSDIGTSQIIVLEEIIEEIQALGDGWIPVTERFPYEGQTVLIELNRKGISYHTRIFIKGEFCDSECGYGMLKSYPIRWMPLPLPPKQ